MKYPITPDYIKKAPEVLVAIYRGLEQDVIADICERFKLSGATATALEHIRTLQRRGYSLGYIKGKIKKATGLSEAELNRVLRQALDDTRKYYGDTITMKDILHSAFDSSEMMKEVDRLIAACKFTVSNFTNSLGFSVRMLDGTLQYMPVAAAYQYELSRAEVAVWSGTMSYSEAIRRAVKELTDSGLKVITWSDEALGEYHIDRVDVAVRRAVMTGITQLAGKYSDAIAKEVPTEYFEITAHVGARTTERKGRPWTNHKKWQGKVYSTSDNDPQYPSIYKVCGLGEVDGLEGANCRHLHYPFWPGISERTYTDEELANIDPPPFEYNDQTYNAYEASQYQRALERQIRRYRRECVGFDASGDEGSYQTAAIKLRQYEAEYRDFCEAGNLRPDDNRTYVQEYGPRDDRKVDKALMNS